MIIDKRSIRKPTMTKNEELNLLLEIMKKYDLPLSPILEYAIKTKMDECLGDSNSTPVANSVGLEELSARRTEIQAVADTPRLTAKDEKKADYGTPIPRTTRKIINKKTKLRVTRPDGSTIEYSKATLTQVTTIQEIGVEIVRSLNISLDGMNLILIGENPIYPTQQYYLGDGYYLNTHSSTERKKYHLEKVFKALGIDWKVEIVPSEW